MNTAPTPSIWNETYSTKNIPIQVCASPSIFVNMNPMGNDPLTSMTQSIRNKNKYAAKLKSQSDDPSLTWEDTYSDPTNCSPCYVNACPTPKITVNTANGGGGIGPDDNIATTGSIICGSLFVSTEAGKNGIFLTKVNNNPILSLTSEKAGQNSTNCALTTTSIVLSNTDSNTGNKDTEVTISGLDGTIELGGYIQVGINKKTIPTNKNMGYCATSNITFTNQVSRYTNIPLDKITYSTSLGCNYNDIFYFISNSDTNGMIYAYYTGVLGDYPLIIEQDGTYSIQTTLSIQQSNDYTSNFPPTIEVLLGYYSFSNFTGKPISFVPSRMTLSSVTNSTTGITQYNYSSFVNMGHLISGVGNVVSAKGDVIIAYLYQFEEAVPPSGPIIIPPAPQIELNDGKGLYVNVIPSFVITKLT